MEKISKSPTILDKTLNDLINGLTGVALSDKTSYILTASKLLKGVRSGKFLSILNQEWEEMQKKGKISSNFEFDEIYYDSLSEILDYLDNGIPNHNIFDVLKTIFIKSAIEEQKDDLLPLQFLKIAKKLTEGELIVLSTIYRLFKTPALRQGKERLETARFYITLVAQESGLKHNALVEIHEQGLIEKKLITGRKLGDGSGVNINPNFRLTSLGISFCEYIENYNEEN